jgi:hypothetical protein
MRRHPDRIAHDLERIDHGEIVDRVERAAGDQLCNEALGLDFEIGA